MCNCIHFTRQETHLYIKSWRSATATLTKRVVTAKQFVRPEYVPSTEYSTEYRCPRMYNPTIIWMCMASEINPVNWGWALGGDELVSVTYSTENYKLQFLKLVAAVTTADAEHTDFNAVLYVDHVSDELEDGDEDL
ncbi:hypothetical protein PR048_001505 [Dryococelus australis]|uniref:Uncharacterized protein n=1 Tax=Dryococelus australis TaxID=614101 RepID=A0ABQ9IHJ6_9NEOP|nr:hypothetical protein PR048_001505 [Dryococelus australis]